MKAQKFFIVSDSIKSNSIAFIGGLPVNGKFKVVVSAAGSKSEKQRGLQWIWYTEIANAGVGGKHEDTKDGVHLVCKWRFAVPILLRDDEFFSSLYAAWVRLYSKDETRMQWFVDRHVHTESMNTSQMAEYLTDVQRHYGQIVNLTDPAENGLLSAVKR